MILGAYGEEAIDNVLNFIIDNPQYFSEVNKPRKRNFSYLCTVMDLYYEKKCENYFK